LDSCKTEDFDFLKFKKKSGTKQKSIDKEKEIKGKNNICQFTENWNFLNRRRN
jgi:hypothetical protein